MTKKKIHRQLIVIATTLAVPIVPFVIIGELPGDKWLSAVDGNAALFGLSGAGLLCLDILLPIPSSIVGTLLGARLGLFSGFFYTWVGLSLGNVAGYSLARLASVRLRTWLPPFPESTSQALVFLSRPVPVFAEAVALAAGAVRMPLVRFLLLSGAGNAIYALVLAGNGAALIPDHLFGVGLIVPMLVPVAAWSIWQYVEKRQGRHR